MKTYFFTIGAVHVAVHLCTGQHTEAERRARRIKQDYQLSGIVRVAV